MRPTATLSCALLRHIRDARPTELELLAWLGPREAGRYHVLRKAGLLVEREGHIVLSPVLTSADGRAFHFENLVFMIDQDEVRVL